MTAQAENGDGAVLVDRSERGKLALAGPGAREALNGLVTNEVETLEPGHGVYAAVLTPKGKMIGDLRVLATESELLLDMERSALQAIFDVLRHGLVGYEAEIGKRTLECGLLSLIGTGAVRLAGADALPAEEHAHAEVAIGGLRARAVRTDGGVDLLCAADAPRHCATRSSPRGRSPGRWTTRRSRVWSPGGRATASTSTRP